MPAALKLVLQEHAHLNKKNLSCQGDPLQRVIVEDKHDGKFTFLKEISTCQYQTDSLCDASGALVLMLLHFSHGNLGFL